MRSSYFRMITKHPFFFAAMISVLLTVAVGIGDMGGEYNHLMIRPHS